MNYYFKPSLARSQFEFRIRLAEKRLSSYPLDNIDFLMIDLEHPANRIRHAHQCTTDLTGRTIEFLAAAHEVVPNCDETRLDELFRRTLLKGKFYPFTRRYFTYLKHTGDYDAWNNIKSQFDSWIEKFEENPDSASEYSSTCDCVIEGLADMYELTGEEKYIPIAKKIFENLYTPFENAHSHGLMTILRAMLKMGRLTGDEWFLNEVRPFRDQIVQNQYADGSVSEAFPRSRRNEGCSIADWVMINLRYYDLTGDEEALDFAEHSMVNALFFNQFITGGFGHRNYFENGYGTNIEEAWWCCTQTGGMAIVEYAEHAVQLNVNKDGSREIRINFPIPGTYTLNDNGKIITVRIISEYPATYSANVTVMGGSDIKVSFRKPYYTGKMTLSKHEMVTVPGGMTYNMDMPIGHYAEKRDGDWVVKYGPLMLAPMIFSWKKSNSESKDLSIIESAVPAGYIHDNVNGEEFSIIEPLEKDENGFWSGVASGENLPVWFYYDDGYGSHTGTLLRAPANITLINSEGKKSTRCFHPMCYATSNLTLCQTPIKFGYIHAKQEK